MKKVTIRDVARVAGVSPATISRAISGKNCVSPETQARIDKALRETGYLFQEESMPLGKTRGCFYFLMKSMRVNTYARLLNESMIQMASNYGLRVVSVNIENSNFLEFPDQEILKVKREAVENRARGIIISGFSDQRMLPSTKDVLCEDKLPLVFINRSLTPYSFNRILTGSDRGAYMAVKYLIDKGRRNLLMIQLPYQGGKTKGFLDAVGECADESLDYKVQIVQNSGIEEASRAVTEALEENPNIDGILCCEDEIAAGVLRKITELGKKIPRDIDLIGYNDNLAPLLTPPISSVKVPFEEICKSAIEMLMDEKLYMQNASAKTVLLDPQLMIRN